jgi:AcrR family transcriptional regulator
MASRATPVSPPTQLPRGRHGLSREQVTSSQRERMLRAMAEAVAERSYAKTPVAEVLRRAGVSRETFYEHFKDKQDCFLAAYDAGATIVLAAVAEPAEPVAEADGPEQQIDAALARYLAMLAREPAIARTFLVEVYGAGPAALARRVEVQERFTDAVAEMVGARRSDQRFACEMLVAAISALVTQRVCAGRAGELPDLHAPLMGQIKTVLTASGLSSTRARK